MSSASRPPISKSRRTALTAITGLAAGGALQWTLVKPGASAPGPDTSIAQSKTPANSQPAPAPAPTADSLRTQTRTARLTSLAEALPRMSVSEILPLVELLSAGRPEPNPYPDRVADAMLRMLFARWVEIDAPGMIVALEKPPFAYAQGVRGLAVLAYAEAHGVAALDAVRWKWPALSRSAALFLLQRQPELADALVSFRMGGSADGEAVLFDYAGDFMDAEEALGPERSVTFAAAAGDVHLLNWAVREIAEKDLARALNLARAVPDGRLRDAVMADLLHQLAGPFAHDERSDGLTFTAQYEALPPDSRLRETFLAQYACVVAPKNPAAAVEWARTFATPKLRGLALDRVAGWIAHDDPSGATKVFAEAWLADPATHDCEFSAANNYGHYTGSWFGMRDIVNSFYGWHEKDPAAADAWFQTLTNTDLRAELAIGASLPSRVLSMTPSSEYRLIGAMDLLSSGIPGRDPRPEEVPADLRHTAELFMTNRYGADDKEWNSATADERRFLSASTMKSKARENPAAALEFFDSLPPEQRSLGAWYQAGAAWIKQDPEEASLWMDSLPQGPERDAATTALVENLSASGKDQDLEAAFAWAASMRGEAERERYLTNTIREWAKQDQNAAFEAIVGGSLPQGEVKRLMGEILRDAVWVEGGAK